MSLFGTFESTCHALRESCRGYPDGPPRVLDVGCGTGEMLAFVAGDIREGCGVDITHDAIASARRNAASLSHIRFERAAVEELPSLGLGTFDLVFIVGALEHMADPAVALRAVHAHTHAASRVVIVALSPKAPHAIVSRWMLAFTDHPVIGHLSVDALAELGSRTGYALEEAYPLYRGSRRTKAARGVGALLGAYDTLGGPTRAVVLAPQHHSDSSPLGESRPSGDGGAH